MTRSQGAAWSLDTQALHFGVGRLTIQCRAHQAATFAVLSAYDLTPDERQAVTAGDDLGVKERLSKAPRHGG
jgi:hypothetical protein